MKNYRLDKENLKQNRTAINIVNKCITAQENVSKLLQDKSEMLSAKSKKTFLIAFCLLSLGSCAYILIHCFKGSSKQFFSVTDIRVPNKVVYNGGQRIETSVGVTKEELGKIQKLRVYMDSLANSESGKKILDSIIINRAGLMDSLTTIENIYHLQSSKK
ncbi:MAG: hypothetical protein WKF91_15090 [Segetibacter sp.]